MVNICVALTVQFRSQMNKYVCITLWACDASTNSVYTFSTSSLNIACIGYCKHLSATFLQALLSSFCYLLDLITIFNLSYFYLMIIYLKKLLGIFFTVVTCTVIVTHVPCLPLPTDILKHKIHLSSETSVTILLKDVTLPQLANYITSWPELEYLFDRDACVRCIGGIETGSVLWKYVAFFNVKWSLLTWINKWISSLWWNRNSILLDSTFGFTNFVGNYVKF